MDHAERVERRPQQHTDVYPTLGGEAQDVQHPHAACRPESDRRVIQTGRAQSAQERILFRGAVRAGALVASTYHRELDVQVPVGEPDALARGQGGGGERQHRRPAVHQRYDGLRHADGGIPLRPPGLIRSLAVRNVPVQPSYRSRHSWHPLPLALGVVPCYAPFRRWQSRRVYHGGISASWWLAGKQC